MSFTNSTRWVARLAPHALCLSLVAPAAHADEVALAAQVQEPDAEHVDQHAITGLVRQGRFDAAFQMAFDGGDELFETVFNALDGVGAHVGEGQRFTRVPRADLSGRGEWADHFPPRETGPNASSCNACHNTPSDDGSGPAAANVHRDPLHSGDMRQFIQRNTPHTFAMGPVQRLAEEMTSALQKTRAVAGQQACASGTAISKALVAKGVSFGTITARPTGGKPCAAFDTTQVAGVDSDLVVRPFQWKGSVAFVRDFNRGAAHNELGMQAVELVGEGIDGDFDGVADELGVGDMTALAVYLSAQPRPTTTLELADLGLVPRPTFEQVTAIRNGARTFQAIGCADCHVPRQQIDDPIFREPSANPSYRDALFPSGADPLASEVDPKIAVRFDLTRDQPDNRIVDARGRVVFRLGSLTKDSRGKALVDLYGDLKRHDMGPALAENIDEVGTGASVFMTENLWGVGSTAPYLHDGRATTLTEAISLHGGEAQASRDRFAALGADSQKQVIAFLDNLVLFKLPPPPTTTATSPTR